MKTSTTQIERTSRGLGLAKQDAAAQGCFVVIRPGRRRVIRLLESLLYPFVRAWEMFNTRTKCATNEVFRILVVEYSFLGDIIMLLPPAQLAGSLSQGAHYVARSSKFTEAFATSRPGGRISADPYAMGTALFPSEEMEPFFAVIFQACENSV